MGLYEAGCDRCAYQRKLFHVLRSYKLQGDEYRLNVQQAFAWCPDCRHVVHTERLDNVPALEAELDESSSLGKELYAELASPSDGSWQETKERHVNDLRRRIEWRRSRVAPPRCLECGSSNISNSFEADDEDEFMETSASVHPGCGGRLRVASVGFSRSRDWIFYTPEGIRIETCEACPSAGLVKRTDA